MHCFFSAKRLPNTQITSQSSQLSSPPPSEGKYSKPSSSGDRSALSFHFLPSSHSSRGASPWDQLEEEYEEDEDREDGERTSTGGQSTIVEEDEEEYLVQQRALEIERIIREAKRRELQDYDEQNSQADDVEQSRAILQSTSAPEQQEEQQTQTVSSTTELSKAEEKEEEKKEEIERESELPRYDIDDDDDLSVSDRPDYFPGSGDEDEDEDEDKVKDKVEDLVEDLDSDQDKDIDDQDKDNDNLDDDLDDLDDDDEEEPSKREVEPGLDVEFLEADDEVFLSQGNERNQVEDSRITSNREEAERRWWLQGRRSQLEEEGFRSFSIAACAPTTTTKSTKSFSSTDNTTTFTKLSKDQSSLQKEEERGERDGVSKPFSPVESDSDSGSAAAAATATATTAAKIAAAKQAFFESTQPQPQPQPTTFFPPTTPPIDAPNWNEQFEQFCLSSLSSPSSSASSSSSPMLLVAADDDEIVLVQADQLNIRESNQLNSLRFSSCCHSQHQLACLNTSSAVQQTDI